jgi:hypothetical protein
MDVHEVDAGTGDADEHFAAAGRRDVDIDMSQDFRTAVLLDSYSPH